MRYHSKDAAQLIKKFTALKRLIVDLIQSRQSYNSTAPQIGTELARVARSTVFFFPVSGLRTPCSGAD